MFLSMQCPFCLATVPLSDRIATATCPKCLKTFQVSTSPALPPARGEAWPAWINLWGIAACALAAAALVFAYVVGSRSLTYTASGIGVVLVLVAIVVNRGSDNAAAGVSLAFGGAFCAAILLLTHFAPGSLNHLWKMDSPLPENDPHKLEVVAHTGPYDEGRLLKDDEWIDAVKEAVRQDDLFFRLGIVNAGRLLEQDAASSYLLVNFYLVQMRHGRSNTVERFLPGKHEPKLTDDSGRRYTFIGDRVRKTATLLDPELKVDRWLIFELPPSGFKFLTLEVPASAWGRRGVCRFRIAGADVVYEPAPDTGKTHNQVIAAQSVTSFLRPDLAFGLPQLLSLKLVYDPFTLISEKAKEIEEKKAIVLDRRSEAPDPALGRSIFAKKCFECHTLHGIGAKIGPDLTKSQRGDLDFLLTSIVDPSFFIAKEFRPTMVITSRGIVYNGIVKQEDDENLTLLLPSRLVVRKSDIEKRKESKVSLMPTELLKELNNHEVRSLIAYLQRSNQGPLLATPENAPEYFPYRPDLLTWHTIGTAWDVEKGEIVAPEPQSGKPELLISDLHLAGDFQLTLLFQPGKDGGGAVLIRDASRPDTAAGFRIDFSVGEPLKLVEVASGRIVPVKERLGVANLTRAETWNRLELKVSDSRLLVRLNNKDAVEATELQLPPRRLIVLEGSGVSGQRLRFRQLEMRLPKQEK